MAKLKDEPIELNDVKEFLLEDADFSFEMKVLNILESLGYSCEHGGTYTDPVTNKMREFDIRTDFGSDIPGLSFAIECKNIRPKSPLLAYCVKRKPHEAFHEIITKKSYLSTVSGLLGTKTKRLSDSRSIYRPGEFVAKQIEQIGRASTGQMVSSDGSVYEKLSQALSSAYDLIYRNIVRKVPGWRSAIIPMVVVPDGMLWKANFSETGEQISDPTQISNCSLFVDQTWTFKTDLQTFNFTLSHLEICEASYLSELISDLGDQSRLFADIFD